MEERWRVSSRSEGANNCVQVKRTLDTIRDSKNQDGPVLRVDLAGLTGAVKAGRLDR